MAELDWKHHTIIQSLLSRGPLKESAFRSLFADVTGKNPGRNQQVFNDYLRKINKELAYVQFELRGCRNQYDGEVYYGIVNTIADEQSKLGTNYSVPQIAFFKAVIEAILHESGAEGTISHISSLNVRLENKARQSSQAGSSQAPSSFRQFSLSQKEKTLYDLIRDGWLCSTENGNVGIGIRSFLDLRSWFRCNDIPSCDVCNEAGVKAVMCRNEDCAGRIHSYCLEKKFSQEGVARVCPSCGFDWPYGREKVKQEDELKIPSPDAAGSPAMTKRVRSCRVDATDKPPIAKRLRSCKTELEAEVNVAEDELRVPFPDATGSPTMTKRVRSCRTGRAGDPDKKLRCKVKIDVGVEVDPSGCPMQSAPQQPRRSLRSVRSR
ncbi:uncharacterized protein LOC116257483 [Nymphaea colorata]|nr:uncharacterized protein LOC116257483 [Nymphaea colorata]